MLLNNSGFLQGCSAWACCDVCNSWHPAHRPCSHAEHLQRLGCPDNTAAMGLSPQI